MPFQRTPLRALAVVGRAAIVVFAGDSAVATASSASPARSSGMLDGLVADVLATGVPGYNPSQAWAARALVSNASGLAHFLRSLLAGELLSPNLLREMTTTVEQIPGEPGGPRCGLGLERYDDADGTLWGHSDAIQGYRAVALWNERTGRTVVVAVTMHLLAPAAFDVMQRLIDGGLAATLRR